MVALPDEVAGQGQFGEDDEFGPLLFGTVDLVDHILEIGLQVQQNRARLKYGDLHAPPSPF